VNRVKISNGDPKLETAISYLLTIGVVTCLCLEILGMADFYHFYGILNIAENRAFFIRGQNFFNFLYELFRENHQKDNGIFFMTLGITILILTPYVRVVLSFFYFARNKDGKYALLTLIVGVILSISLALH